MLEEHEAQKGIGADPAITMEIEDIGKKMDGTAKQYNDLYKRLEWKRMGNESVRT